MEAVEIITGTAVPLDRSDVDTDQIIPSDWLKRVERTGFEAGLFAEWRDDRDFVLNKQEHAGANILIAGPQFGTGSSREHAVWALHQYGFRVVISAKFGDIFRNNSTKNGLVPVQLSPEGARTLMEAVQRDPDLEIVVDIETRTVEAQAIDFLEPFPLDDAIQHRFLNGLDDIALTMQYADAIGHHETHRPDWMKKLDIEHNA
ncbi:MAG: 3-isopropylmalate dehydratase small subunit [Actinomycetia bacterium]|nr:3-isopropylmalate dehydratase small subunit [Actinomycetes bacterium]